jgi:hypothetical protein
MWLFVFLRETGFPAEDLVLEGRFIQFGGWPSRLKRGLRGNIDGI